MSITVEAELLVRFRLELPASLSDGEARRLAEEEAVRRLGQLRGVVAIDRHVVDPAEPAPRLGDEPSAG